MSGEAGKKEPSYNRCEEIMAEEGRGTRGTPSGKIDTHWIVDLSPFLFYVFEDEPSMNLTTNARIPNSLRTLLV